MCKVYGLSDRDGRFIPYAIIDVENVVESAILSANCFSGLVDGIIFRPSAYISREDFIAGCDKAMLQLGNIFPHACVFK